MDGKIIIKEIGEQYIQTWKIVIQLDKSVTKFEAYDAKAEFLYAYTYKVTPMLWHAEAKDDEEKLLGLQVHWKPGGAIPNIR